MEGSSILDAAMFYGMLIICILVLILRATSSGSSSSKRESPKDPADAGREASEPVPVREDAFIPGQRAGAAVMGVFVVVTSGDPQTQFLAMLLSTKMKGQGKSVRILLCSDGGHMAIKGSHQTAVKPFGKSPQDMLVGLQQGGVRIEVCPFYFPNHGKSATDMLDGITQSNPDDVANALMEPGIKLFTF